MSSSGAWRLEFRERAEKDLARFPRKDRERIFVVVERLPRDPFAGDIEKMEGEENAWRRRVGAYRIFYEILLRERVIYVYRIERRTSRTY